MRAAKDRAGMEQWILQTSLGAQVQLVSQVGKQFFTEGLCKTVGGLDAFEPAQHRLVEALGGQLWCLAVNMMGELAETSLLRTVPPLCFAPLVHPNRDIAAAALKSASTMWETLSKLEDEAATQQACRQWVQSLEFPLLQWARELLVEMWEANFDVAPPRVLQAL